MLKEVKLLDIVVVSSLLFSVAYLSGKVVGPSSSSVPRKAGGGWPAWLRGKGKRKRENTKGISISRSPQREDSEEEEDDAAYRASTSGSIWERSKAKSHLGYYHAHHSKLPSDGIASHEYEMNGPKALGTKKADVRLPTKFTSYSWEDTNTEVRLDFKQEGWVWSDIAAEEITATWGPRSAKVTVDSKVHGLCVASFPALYGEITGISVKKMKKCLRVVLIKKHSAGWHTLTGSTPVVADSHLIDPGLD